MSFSSFATHSPWRHSILNVMSYIHYKLIAPILVITPCNRSTNSVGWTNMQIRARKTNGLWIKAPQLHCCHNPDSMPWSAVLLTAFQFLTTVPVTTPPIPCHPPWVLTKYQFLPSTARFWPFLETFSPSCVVEEWPPRAPFLSVSILVLTSLAVF